MNKKNVSILVSADPNYIPEQSDPLNQKFVWSYEITIMNETHEIVQLLTRYWKIIDMAGRMEEIKGYGVIGLQPIIKPERKFIYKSFCQLLTPQGTMEGYYEMQNLDEVHFKVQIPKIILSAPSTITRTFRSKLH